MTAQSSEMEITLKLEAVAFNPRRDLPEQVAHPKFYSPRETWMFYAAIIFNPPDQLELYIDFCMTPSKYFPHPLTEVSDFCAMWKPPINFLSLHCMCILLVSVIPRANGFW